ncbi:MAG: DUF2787 domain-containing protein [Methylomonas sp.]|jgi:hypothetical protein|uniref:DUF2787 family protein n=1 Tax=Methylomonas sp. TaxID=418 RepID=UPI0025FEE2AE|nr:DUF2787 family protein [Methylomonas sp.]MCK9608654.1 DUF2787 domain-containing protein [Methylomonas sp.]
MSIQIQTTGYPFSISKKLVTILQSKLDKSDLDISSGATLNFRDPDYSAESGGYHPVEIAVDAEGRILYITDFAYYGSGSFAELDREIDFDFERGVFQHMGREFPIERGASLFRIWQANFCSYVERQIFEVSTSSR